MHIRRLLQIAVLAMFALVIWWLFSDPGSGPPRPLDEPAGERPGQFLETLHLRHFDEHGQLLFELDSSAMRHFSTDGRAEFDEVDLHYFPAEHPPWHLQSLHARIPEDRRNVLLSGEVQLRIQLRGETTNVLLETPVLHIDLDKSQAHSNDGVVLSRGVSRLSANSILVDMDSGQITLEDNVRGSYATN